MNMLTSYNTNHLGLNLGTALPTRPSNFDPHNTDISVVSQGPAVRMMQRQPTRTMPTIENRLISVAPVNERPTPQTFAPLPIGGPLRDPDADMHAPSYAPTVPFTAGARTARVMPVPERGDGTLVLAERKPRLRETAPRSVSRGIAPVREPVRAACTRCSNYTVLSVTKA